MSCFGKSDKHPRRKNITYLIRRVEISFLAPGGSCRMDSNPHDHYVSSNSGHKPAGSFPFDTICPRCHDRLKNGMASIDDGIIHRFLKRYTAHTILG